MPIFGIIQYHLASMERSLTTRAAVKQFVKRVVPRPIWKRLSEWRATIMDLFATPSYSQEGEDIILKKLLGDKPNGFYVDVGAHHPQRLSNTYLFYKRGWRGINIDAAPGSMEPFRRLRPRDINLEVAVAATPRVLTYYMFNDPALNTFDGLLARSRESAAFRIVECRQMVTRTLAELLSEHMPPSTPIDFMTIDVEGFDLEVLMSNDWNRFAPAFVAVEISGQSYWQVRESPVYKYLDSLGYELVAKTENTCIFKCKLS